ncbi:hypothetical protein K493DRAFT_70062 [Basidiobolus meristosporus CBS 931.73]|uniref:Uncharacterized protein n=1 Tax=Basidiobolus meristosporus CBS 931.73 TaxID=1314790 RepID=A0A1Y1XU39_9FUNG|nr:hypothetical protein K493DRAFT_70062 [Basidiobolus meristosporus CBS 931.73]|eukprot:ORX89258.1 hypothetical protein K493DRAFT_70062 [Basidiobolus meristosporus CBS 931.73]
MPLADIDATNEPSGPSSTKARYAVLEALTETSGVLTLLKECVDEQQILAFGNHMPKGEEATFAASFSPLYLENWWTDANVNDLAYGESSEQSDLVIDCEAPTIPDIKSRESSLVAVPPMPQRKDDNQENNPPSNHAADQDHTLDGREALRDAYLKTLYDSKTPLHEFVEAAMDNSSLAEKSHLFEYLEFLCTNLILDLPTLEEKYKASIPSLINRREVTNSTELSPQELDYIKAWARCNAEPDHKSNSVHELKIREYVDLCSWGEFFDSIHPSKVAPFQSLSSNSPAAGIHESKKDVQGPYETGSSSPCECRRDQGPFQKRSPNQARHILGPIVYLGFHWVRKSVFCGGKRRPRLRGDEKVL